MSCVIVSAKKLIGRIEPPPYKSEVIRLLILAGLCGIRPAEFVHLPNNCGEDIKNAVIAVNEAFLIPMPKAEKYPLFGSCRRIRNAAEAAASFASPTALTGSFFCRLNPS